MFRAWLARSILISLLGVAIGSLIGIAIVYPETRFWLGVIVVGSVIGIGLAWAMDNCEW